MVAPGEGHTFATGDAAGIEGSGVGHFIATAVVTHASVVQGSHSAGSAEPRRVIGLCFQSPQKPEPSGLSLVPLATARGRLAQEPALGPGCPTPIAVPNGHGCGLGSEGGTEDLLHFMQDGAQQRLSPFPVDSIGVQAVADGDGDLLVELATAPAGCEDVGPGTARDDVEKVAAAAFVVASAAILGGRSCLAATSAGFGFLLQLSLPQFTNEKAYLLLAKATAIHCGGVERETAFEQACQQLASLGLY